MKRALNLLVRLAVFGPLVLFTASSSKLYGQATGHDIGLMVAYAAQFPVSVPFSGISDRHRRCRL